MRRAQRRSMRYMTSYCEIIAVTHERDPFGYIKPDAYREVLYAGNCMVSPGNMWPFETSNDVMRGARTDVQIYVPKDVQGLSPECIVRYDEHDYEVIAFASPVTAGATLNITARRVS